MHTIHLVEDEKNLNQVLKTYLENEGFIVTSFYNGNDALKSIPNHPDLWILDIMLPDIDGFQLIKNIKNNDKNSPVIFISARDADLDKIKGLEMGSDDYLPKPFLPKELVIRTKRILERVYQNQPSLSAINLEPYCVFLNERKVTLQNETIELSSKEFDFISLMASNIGKIYSREELLTYIWGENYFGSNRVVDDLIRRVRKKLPELKIETIYSYGYRLNR